MSFRTSSGQPEDGLASSSSSSAAAKSAQQLSGDMPIRRHRVEALRAQIEAGAYMVNPHAVANAIFQNFFGAEDPSVQDPDRCLADDRLRRSECLAVRRCECKWGQDDDDSKAESLAG